ncbi:MAG: ribosome recycling factor [Candidatus Nomurabacteria bacterium]|jgi:ribosome recycling factor|nr:ribosome recycling factor [Candidatus Nomurabacteria bacterium]
MFDSKPFDDKFTAAIEHFKEELKKVRTGRAHPSMLEGVMVEVYGTKMPINQTANILAQEATQLLVTPFDPANIEAISAAIRNEQSLGLNPADDGRNIRITLPPLTEERRREIVKSLSEKVEETRVTLRNIRQDALKSAKQLKDDKKLTQDDVTRIEKDIDDTISNKHKELEELVKAKENEIMTI